MNNSPNKICKIPATWLSNLFPNRRDTCFQTRPALRGILKYTFPYWKKLFESMIFYDFLEYIKKHEICIDKNLDRVLTTLIEINYGDILLYERIYEDKFRDKSPRYFKHCNNYYDLEDPVCLDIFTDSFMQEKLIKYGKYKK